MTVRLVDALTAVGARTPLGWDVLASLGPLDGRVCTVCAGPAVVGTVHGFRCRMHPPTWGQALDWTPRGRPCPGRRCYCGRCPSYRVGSNTSSNALGTTDLKKQRVALGGVSAQREAVAGRRGAGGGNVPTPTPQSLSGRPPASSRHPGTSHTAAARITGLPVGRIRLDVFRAIRHAGDAGLTDDEIEVLLGRPHQTVSSARNALVRAGYVVPFRRPSGAELTRPTRSGAPATVWVVSIRAEHLPP